MPREVINNGETGLVVRNKLNSNFTELYDRNEFTNSEKTNLGILTGGAETALHKHDLLVEQNASLDIKIWVGTQTQYDAITTPNANTLYFIRE